MKTDGIYYLVYISGNIGKYKKSGSDWRVWSPITSDWYLTLLGNIDDAGYAVYANYWDAYAESLRRKQNANVSTPA